MKPSLSRGIALGALLALVATSGCKVGTDYEAPQATVNASYAQIDEEKGVRQQVGSDVSSWWSQMNDPALAQLTREAVADNLTLREALFRIQTARASLGVSNANRLPQVSESGGYTHGRSSTSQSDYSAFDLATGMSWEVDVFGRLSRLVEAANADMEVQREMYRDAYVILTADVAQSYVDARSYQEQIRISQENITIQRSTYEITQTKNEAGSASKLDESQALGVCRGTESNLLSLQTMYQQALNRLSILVGRPPGHVDALLSAPAPIPSAPEEILVGIPADLLRRRPDIRAAEQRIIAQNARVGAAIGDLYPIFSLNGSFGLEANSVGNLFDESAVNAAVGPSFRWNVLNFGKYRFNVEAQRFAQEQLVAAYRQTVLEAAEDVDNALVSYVNERDRLSTLSEAVDAYTYAYELSNERYKAGRIDFQRLLDSQAGKLSYELQYMQCRASMASSVVRLYRALGGDWAGGQALPEAGPIATNANAPAAAATATNVVASPAPRGGMEPEYNPGQEWAARRVESRARVAADLNADGENAQVAAASSANSDGPAIALGTVEGPAPFLIDLNE